jgi:hypothetical protein
VLLIGTSDLDFIVEHCCYHYKLNFRRTSQQGSFVPDNHTLLVYAENIPVKAEEFAPNSLFLSQLLIKSPIAT